MSNEVSEPIELITISRQELQTFLEYLYWAANRFSKYTINSVVRKFCEEHGFDFLEIKQAAERKP